MNEILNTFFVEFKTEFIDNGFDKYRPGVTFPSGIAINDKYLSDALALLFVILKEYSANTICYDDLIGLCNQTDLSKALTPVIFILERTLKDTNQLNSVINSILFLSNSIGLKIVQGRIDDTTRLNFRNGIEDWNYSGYGNAFEYGIDITETFKVHKSKILTEHLEILDNIWNILGLNNSFISLIWNKKNSKIPALFLTRNNEKRVFVHKDNVTHYTDSKHPLYNEFTDLILSYDCLSYKSYYSIWELKLVLNSDETIYEKSRNNNDIIMLDDLLEFNALLKYSPIFIEMNNISVDLYNKFKNKLHEYNNIHLSGSINFEENELINSNIQCK